MSTPTSELPIVEEVGAELNRLFAAQEERVPRLRWTGRRWLRGLQRRRLTCWATAMASPPD